MAILKNNFSAIFPAAYQEASVIYAANENGCCFCPPSLLLLVRNLQIVTYPGKREQSEEENVWKGMNRICDHPAEMFPCRSIDRSQPDRDALRELILLIFIFVPSKSAQIQKKLSFYNHHCVWKWQSFHF